MRTTGRLVAGIVVGCLVFMAACGDGDDGSASGGTTTEGSGAPTGRIDIQVSGGESEIEAFKELARNFEASHPDTRVELVGVADQGEHIAKLATAFAGGAPPDAFLINHRRMGRFVDAGAVEPAAPGDLDVAGLYEPPVKAFTFSGTLACLPQNVSSIVTYVNPALFARAGVALPAANWNFADALTTAGALSAAGIEAIGFDTELRSVAPFVWAAGGEVVDSTESPTKVALGSPEGRKAIQFLLDLQKSGLDATERAASEPQARFAAGELAMFFDSRRSVPAFRKANLDFDVTPLPRDVEQASLLATDGWCVSKAAKNKPLAQAFARYAVGQEGATVLASTGRTVPSLRSLAESPAFLDPVLPPKNARVFLDVIPQLHQLPSVAAWNETEIRASDTLQQLFAEKTSIDQAVSEIESETAALLKK
jgi:multiple sugar transport system substrate-binding protein